MKELSEASFRPAAICREIARNTAPPLTTGPSQMIFCRLEYTSGRVGRLGPPTALGRISEPCGIEKNGCPGVIAEASGVPILQPVSAA